MLSFAWPGLGQLYAGRARPALIFAAPIGILALLLALRLAAGVESFAVGLLDPTFALSLLVLVVLAGAWRIASMVDASRALRPRPFQGRSGRWLVALIAIVVVSHLVLASYVWAFYGAGTQIFVPNGSGPVASGDPNASPGATPFPIPETPLSRITVLVTGIDHTTNRTEFLTDTLLVVSVDPVTKTASMVSIPRDIAGFPLYTGGRYAGKINSFMTYAGNHPKEFPAGAMSSLTSQVGFLLGIPIHYYAALDLDGFERLIDVVGGITVTVDRAINDPRYAWLDGTHGFKLSAGVHTLDGRTALAYVRSRQGVGDSDFTRAARQQQLLLALRQKVTEPSMLTKLPELLDVVAQTIRTNYPSDRIDDLMTLMREVGDTNIERVVLQPPTYSFHPPSSETGGTYTLRIRLAAVRALSVRLFGDDSAFWTGTFDADGSPVPGPQPTPG